MGESDDPYLLYNDNDKKLYIYDDNKTKDDKTDDKLLGSYPAHNNVSSKSKGKWEDGEYEMLDKNERKTHTGNETDGTTPQDSPEGRYGTGGIYRAKNFKETNGKKNTRSGMAVHAGRENKEFLKRKTNGCIRTTCEAMAAIDEAISQNGPLNSIIIQNNKPSTSSASINSLKLPKTMVESYFSKLFKK